MPRQALFAGLIIDEHDNPVGTALVGDEPCYVVDDLGFRRHIPSEQVDRQILAQMKDQLSGHEQAVSAEAARMLGQEDPFSVAMLENQMKNIDQQFDALLQSGIPEELRAYLGMMGFKVVIDIHGQVLRFDQPAAAADDDE